jgi:hypothetical protein
MNYGKHTFLYLPKICFFRERRIFNSGKKKGHILKYQTIVQYHRHLVNYRIPKFGKLPLDKIRPAAVEDYLFSS